MQNKNKANFIKTQDKETAEQLKIAGLELINYSDNTWTFINDPNCKFTFDNKTFTYSNVLCI